MSTDISVLYPGEMTKFEESGHSASMSVEDNYESEDLPLSSIVKSGSRKRRLPIQLESSDDEDEETPLATLGNRASATGDNLPANSSPPKKTRRVESFQNGNSALLNSRTQKSEAISVDSGTSGKSRLKKSSGANGSQTTEKRARPSSRLSKSKKTHMSKEDSWATHASYGEVNGNRKVKKEEAFDEDGIRPVGSTKAKAELVAEVKRGRGGGVNGCITGEDDDKRWWDAGKGGNDGVKWTTLEHHGVVFPPEYEPHGVPMKYKGEPVELEAKAEEIATFYAAKLETDYVKKDVFNKNFFDDFKSSLKGTSAAKIVRKLNDCSFSDIHAHLEKIKAGKKAVPLPERKKLKEAERVKMEKYTVALVDGREEKIGNFRVEPPGLFLGRGEHPKMGKVKARIYPENVTINIGENSAIPECLSGHQWGEIVHKHDVTWLAGWKDSITNGHKYVWLSAGSAFKGMSDLAKFEKARKLKDFIDSIRKDYTEGWKAKSKEVRQRSVAMYLIDKLALRVGNEKGEDEADTVGCCSLRVEHIKFLDNNVIEFDFLGKDSIRYLNEVVVEQPVYRNLQLFSEGKNSKQLIFHRLSVTGLNDYLKNIMPGLSAKVFRTYNASVTLSGLLDSTNQSASMTDKLVFYNQQNKEVAILCNHQRALPKSHGAQMEKLEKKEREIELWIKELKRGLKVLSKKDGPDKVELTQRVPVKAEVRPDMTDEQRAAERKRAAEAPKLEKKINRSMEQVKNQLKQSKERLIKVKADMTVKDELKTVALGTSKINYLDPRITVAWCKKHNVPIEKIFARTLLVKFAWAMETSENFRF